MFIRRARTRNKATGEAYFTHRLVDSLSTGKQVRQVTLLNLGRHFDLPQSDWPAHGIGQYYEITVIPDETPRMPPHHLEEDPDQGPPSVPSTRWSSRFT
jgi:hypothetical protein